VDKNRFEFFLVALPGLEDVVLAEALEWFPGAEAKAEHGGVTVYAGLGQGLAMNLVLKTPTRILLRVASFRVRDFPKLHKELTKIPWEKWIDPSCELEVKVATRLSRLKIKARIEETCLDAWMDYAAGMKAKTVRGKKASLYVRMLNDVCTLSLDSSGERLHKRGARVFVGEAPLRETTASALIQMTGRTDPDAGEVEIIDPMMGSGVFLIEAAYRDRPVAERDFAFASFANSAGLPPSLSAPRARVVRLTGFEADKKTIEAARANLSGISNDYELDLHGEDFFKAKPLPAAKHRRWLFCNPPWGERLQVKEPLRGLYERLFAACESVVQPDRACFLLPSKAVKGKFLLPAGWKVLEKRPFVNGGIPVTAFVFGRVADAVLRS
jgi:putative N6-adenine-specific DNA methylase